MVRSHKRLLALLGMLLVLVLLTTVLYMAGMSYLEGKPRGFWDALEWAGESLSTTGYGRDSNWSHPLMVSYVVLVQFVGVFLVFLVFPIYLIPFFEERFETRLREKQSLLHGILSHIPYSVFWKDRQGRYLGARQCGSALAEAFEERQGAIPLAQGDERLRQPLHCG